jgi:hypothetical protein
MKCSYFTGISEKVSPDEYEWSDIKLSKKKKEKNNWVKTYAVQ